MVNPGTWTLSGLLDFETAMTGDRAYEFAAAGLFVSRGDPRLLGRIRPRLRPAYTLLHRHSNLPECLAELPAPPELTMDSLALTWFGRVPSRRNPAPNEFRSRPREQLRHELVMVARQRHEPILSR